jgi:hypothetical protein
MRLKSIPAPLKTACFVPPQVGNTTNIIFSALRGFESSINSTFESSFAGYRDCSAPGDLKEWDENPESSSKGRANRFLHRLPG